MINTWLIWAIGSFIVCFVFWLGITIKIGPPKNSGPWGDFITPFVHGLNTVFWIAVVIITELIIALCYK